MHSPQTCTCDDRLHCHRRMAEEQAIPPVPNPSSPCQRRNLSGDLYSTALADLDRHILGVCDTPEDNVNVASNAMSITSLYFATFVPLSKNL